MKYETPTEHTAEPVTNIITDQCMKLTALINKTEKFWHGHYEVMPEGKIHVAYKGSVPVHVQGEVFLFQRLEVYQWSKEELTTTSKELIKELLEEIGIKRLYDEDAMGGGILWRNKGAGSLNGDAAYCYINPNMPEGYWENHMLENRYVDLH